MQGVALMQYLTTREAAERAGLTLHGLRLSYHRYPGLAVKVAGRWRVDAQILSRVLEGCSPERGNRDVKQEEGSGLYACEAR
jgi:hypothetical protein